MERGSADTSRMANICRLVLHLDGRLDARTLRAAIGESGFEQWLANVQWSRLMPFMVPRWRARPGVGELFVREHDASGAPGVCGLPQEVVSRVVSPFKPPAFAFDLVHRTIGATTLVFTWHHVLMDARGAEMLLAHIGRRKDGYNGVEAPVFINHPPPTLKDGIMGWMKLPVRAYFARKAIHVAVRSCRPPIASVRLQGGDDPSDGQVFRVMSFDSEQTASVERTCARSSAKFRKSLYCLAATIRAVNAIKVRRGCRPAAYVVPVPHESRKRGAQGPVIGNQITFLFYRVEQEDIASRDRLLASLGEQMNRQIYNRIPEGFLTTMELFRNLPIGIFALQAFGPTKGQIASLFFSFPGETCRGLDDFIGVPLGTALHIPPVSLSPGFSIVFTKHRDRLFAVLSLAEGCLDNDEIDLFESLLRLELLAGGQDAAT